MLFSSRLSHVHERLFTKTTNSTTGRRAFRAHEFNTRTAPRTNKKNKELFTESLSIDTSMPTRKRKADGDAELEQANDEGHNIEKDGADGSESYSEDGSESSGEDGSESSSEDGSEGIMQVRDNIQLGECEFIKLGMELDRVLTYNAKYAAHLNEDDRNAGKDLLGTFYTVLMAESIGCSKSFLMAIRTGARKAAVDSLTTYIRSTDVHATLCRKRLSMLKEAVSLAVFNYAAKRTPSRHPLTGQRLPPCELATEEFDGSNSLA